MEQRSVFFGPSRLWPVMIRLIAIGLMGRPCVPLPLLAALLPRGTRLGPEWGQQPGPEEGHRVGR